MYILIMDLKEIAESNETIQYAGVNHKIESLKMISNKSEPGRKYLQIVIKRE